MRKLLDFLKTNLTFFIIVAISLIFYFIAIFGGDYQTTIFFGEVTHRKFISGIQDGVPLSFAYVILPIVFLVAICLLYFFKPKKIDGSYQRPLPPRKPFFKFTKKKEENTIEVIEERSIDLSVIFVALFIGISTLAGALFVLIPFALFKESTVVYYQIVDWKASAADVYYIKTFNFPLLSMVFCLIATSVLGCYASATMSE